MFGEYFREAAVLILIFVPVDLLIPKGEGQGRSISAKGDGCSTVTESSNAWVWHVARAEEMNGVSERIGGVGSIFWICSGIGSWIEILVA